MKMKLMMKKKAKELKIMRREKIAVTKTKGSKKKKSTTKKKTQ